MKLDKDILIPAELEINPWTYLDIVLKYEHYLKLIKYFGGYMFIQQIYKFSSKSEHQTFDDVHAMEKNKLLKIINVNNNKYVLLTHTSIKYLKNKSNVAHLQKPTSTQLKSSCLLAEYIDEPKEFFDSSKPYVWFLEKCKTELQKYKIDSAADMEFLNKNKGKVKSIKSEEIKSLEFKDAFSLLNTSKIYFDTFENGVVTFIFLDFERSKSWIYNALLEKIEPIFRSLSIYNSYNIKILTMNENRKERLIKDESKMNRKGLLFLKDIHIINLNTDRFFQSIVQKESFLKDIDKLEIATLQEKLRNNVKGGKNE
ncbi:hypothetical protein LGK95_20775 [Clostridium algoriphilum]|uniref:hypothetical protein n=1 Tax=Clostridium algoriphilum TaxID=198347 RepID=UPI001CF51524|nr:hypothetical protein [Clostridium algoriphilum]MCB2295899.1 hypothetical protein [Clostridium algoriphilum]